LNRPAPETLPDIPPAETELPINCDKRSKAEIRKTIATLKNGKAAGPDNKQQRLLKQTHLSPSYTTCKARSGRRRRYQPSGRRDLS
jgi:hypothetical protein